MGGKERGKEMTRIQILAGRIQKANDIDFRAFDCIYTGFSGGADSTILLLVLQTLAQEIGFQLQAVHFEHGLRGQESIDDMASCIQFCSNRGIPIQTIKLNVHSSRLQGEGIEEAARRLRLNNFNYILGGKTRCAVALGHHLDDRLENLLIRLARGSNTSALASPRHVANIDGLTILRPLLDISKSEIEDTLSADAISWRIDSTNYSENHVRNRIRKRITPELRALSPHADKGIARSLSLLEADAGFIETHAAAELRRINQNGRLPAAALAALPSPVAFRVLRLWTSERTTCQQLFGWRTWERVSAHINSDSTTPISIPVSNSLSIKLTNGFLHISNQNIEQHSLLWPWRETPEIQWEHFHFNARFITPEHADVIACDGRSEAIFDSATLPHPLIIRNQLPDDRMTPFGSGKLVRLKKLYPNNETKQNPVVCSQDGIVLWLPEARRSSFHPAFPGQHAVKLLMSHAGANTMAKSSN